MNTLYIHVTTVIFIYLTVMWSRDHIINVIYKMVFCLSAIVGIVLSLNTVGFIVRI